MAAPKCNAGFSLIEALIAAFILSIGALTIIALQARTVLEYRDSKMRQYATIFAADLTDRIRANSAAAGAYDSSNLSSATARACATSESSPCAPAELAADDLFRWKGWLQSLGFNVETGDTAADSSVSVDTSVTPATVAIILRWTSGSETRQVAIDTEAM